MPGKIVHQSKKASSSTTRNAANKVSNTKVDSGFETCDRIWQR